MSSALSVNMIILKGTSHIAAESVAATHSIIEEQHPDIVAVELDQQRLQALLSGTRGRAQGIIPRLILRVQRMIGKETGIMPGDDMLAAVSAAQKHNTPIALIDQPIAVTIHQLRALPAKEKVKLMASLFGAVTPLRRIATQSVDMQTVPEDEFIASILAEMQRQFPRLYYILVERRNHVMAQALYELQDAYTTVVAFVGAGHVAGIAAILRHNDIPVTVQ